MAPGTTAGNKHKDLMRLVMFMSFRLSPTESKYSTQEREGLAVMRNLDDCAWLVKESPWPVKIYTDHFSLISIMQTNTKDAHGRLARSQDRLTEYNYEIIHKPGIDHFMKLADGLSRLPSEYCNEFRGDLLDRLTMCLGARKAKRGKSGIDGEEVITEADRIKYGRVKKIKLKVKKKLWGGAIGGTGNKVDRGDDDVVMQELAGEEGDVDTVVGCSREEMDVASEEREVEKDVEMSDITESVGELKSGIGVRAERIGRNKKNAKKETRGVRKNKGKKELGKKGKSEEGGGGCMEGIDSTERIIEELMENMGESVFERGQVCMEVDGEGEAEMGKEVGRGREEELVLPEVRELIAKKAEVEDKSRGERGDNEVRIESAGVNLAEESGEEELSLGGIDRDERTKDGERKDEKWRGLGELGRKVSEEGKREADNLKDYKALSWYGDVVRYLEGGMKELAENQSLSCNGLRNVVRKSVRFAILDDGLFWKERDGSLAKCILEDEVDFALRNVHDVHGHFAGGISVGPAIGAFYWPTREKDVWKYCLSCDTCQRVGPRRKSGMLKPIVQFRPFDMVGMDYIGPISPACATTGARYILIVVDYFSRFVFGRAFVEATQITTLSMFFETVVPIFGWPMSVYCDNGSHFVGNDVKDTFIAFGVTMLTAPISHPSSVGLSERYVQMVIGSLRRHCIATNTMKDWGMQVAAAVTSLNTRRVRVHGHTPSEILLGFNARLAWPALRMRDGRVQSVGKEIGEMVFDTGAPERWNVEELLATRDYKGDDMIMKRIAEQERAAASHDGKVMWETPVEGDLVMVRRHEIDQQKGRKLESRWDGPRLLVRMSARGNSAFVRELHGTKEKRYHVDNLKVYVRRGVSCILKEGASGVAYESAVAEEGAQEMDGKRGVRWKELKEE